MKRHILTAIILIASYAANAQFTAGLDGGLSVPASDYGSKSLPSPNSTTINGYENWVPASTGMLDLNLSH